MEYHNDTGSFTQHFYLAEEEKCSLKLAGQSEELEKSQQREAGLNLNLASQTKELKECQQKDAECSKKVTD